MRAASRRWSLKISNSLTFCNDRPQKIQIASQFINKMCKISIRHNGIGFEHQYVERSFELFKPLHKDEYPGRI